MNDQPQPQPRALDRQKFCLFVFVDREDEGHPKAEAARVGGHGAVGVIEPLHDPWGCALSELVEEGVTDGH